jgi:hypothetical protein
MKKNKLSAEEQGLLDSYEKGEWQSSKPSNAELQKFQKAARVKKVDQKSLSNRITRKNKA